MLRRPPGEGRLSHSQQKLIFAFALLFFACLHLVDAQQQQPQDPPQRRIPEPALPRLRRDDNSEPLVDDAAIHQWAATPVEAVEHARETIARKQSPSSPPVPKHQQPHVRRSDGSGNSKNGKSDNRDTQPIIIPNDASALATLAPAQSVRAPHPPRHLRPSSSAASGLASPQIARSLEDWEVEDFVLLATVDGHLYANDRKTGKERWRVELDHPMVETSHYRANSSILDDDYSPVDHYIWAVEPNKDGGLYVWIPDSDAGLVRTGFTMKRLVEELAPYADEEPPVVYTGDKKTTMLTLDASNGRVLKWFGSSGAHVIEAESCVQPNMLYDMQSEECSSTGTITLGRTEYTVGIQRRDGRAIATLKYSEWGPNNFDNDLWQQHHASLDKKYITSQHDGKVYAFDWSRAESAAPLFSQKFSAPVARVFDICRPWDAPRESNPELVVLPQPPMPSQDESIARMRSNSIFLNQTDAGSWYAMSGRAYPLIINAPAAPISQPEWWDMSPTWDTISESKLNKALVGTHFMESLRPKKGTPQTLPPGTINVGYDDPDNDSILPVLPDDATTEATLLTKVKSLPKSAADSVVDFISNPILIILFVFALIYNEKKLRRAYHRFRREGNLKESLLSLISDRLGDAKDETPSAEDLQEDESVHDNAVDEKLKEKEPSDDFEKVEEILEDSFTEISGPHPAEQNESIGTSGDHIVDEAQKSAAEGQTEGDTAPEKKKRARGRRGGAKHRKKRAGGASPSRSREDEPENITVEEAVNNAKKLGDGPRLEPDVMTVANDMQAVSGPIIKMGNIEVNTDDQLGTGSNGTLVFAGKFDGREVAVKRMLIQFYDIASQETKLLRESDDHPNVIRYYSQQIRDGFLFIALERCAASLADVVEKPQHFRELANAGRRDLPNILYQITNGINHLHALRIVHRDLKPQNILVNMGKDGKPRMLVSDFGLCKKLEDTQSSFGATTGRAAGTSGWRAPELLLDDDARDAEGLDASTHSGSGSVLVNDGLNPGGRRATRAIDIFSLGLVFFYVLTNGSHPYDNGDRYMREVNIRKDNYNLRLLDSFGDFAFEAKDLVASMLEADPKRRPNTREIMSHPFFWSAKKRLAFLCDVSDHFEKEPRDPPSPALAELERHAMDVTKGDFLRVLPRDFVDSLGKQRKYTGSRLLDLLRALRNKRNHYEDMPEALKRTVGPLPEGYLGFWTRKFPMLLLVCWNVVYNVRWEETDRFREYYEPAAL